MRKQFNLQDWLKDKSQKVETRFGLPVRIICWDRRGERPLVVLVQHPNGYDEGRFYYENGLADGVGQESDGDLFLVTPEPEMTDFEKKLWEVLKSECSPIGPIEKFTNADKEVFHSYVAELLTLARKQLQPEIDSMLEDAYKTADEVQYRKGREEALKDMPRWKKVGFNTGQTTLVIGYTGEEDKLYRNGYVISLSDLEKLPKEDEK